MNFKEKKDKAVAERKKNISSPPQKTPSNPRQAMISLSEKCYETVATHRGIASGFYALKTKIITMQMGKI